MHEGAAPVTKRKVPTRHLLAGYAALYGPSTERKRREAERLVAEHCLRIERGVPANPPLDSFAEGAMGTSRRCPASETTPAGEARCSGDASAEGRGGLPLGDSPTYSDAA